jgi:hypothetical protein
MANAFLSEKLDEVLSRRYPGASEEFVQQTRELLEMAHADSAPQVVEAAAAKFRWAFCLDAELREDNIEDDAKVVDLATLLPQGWFTRYLEWTAEHESPTQFHVGSILTLCAAGMRRRPLLEWGARPTYPNLYTLLIGPSASRKGSAIDKALTVARLPFELDVLPGDGTYQGYHAALAKVEARTGDATGIIVAPEFTTCVRDDQHKGGLVDNLTDWYDGVDAGRALASGILPLNNICLCLLGGTTRSALRKLPTEVASGGWAPRHLIFEGTGRRHRKWNPKFNDTLYAELVGHLAKLGPPPERMRFSAAASRYLENWYEKEQELEYRATHDELVRAWLDRKQAALMKVAMVLQYVTGQTEASARAAAAWGTELRVEFVDSARRIVDWTDASVRSVYSALGTTDDGELVQAVLACIDRAGGEVRETAIKRALRKRWRSPRIIEALMSLKGDDLERVVRADTGVLWRRR